MTTDPTAARCTFAFDHESASHARSSVQEFAEMRRSCPVAWTESHGGYWVATKYEDILAIAQNPKTFTSNKEFDQATGEVKGGLSIPPFPTPRGLPDESDSPEWDGLRGFLNRRMAPKAVEARRERTERFAAALLDMVIERGSFDLVDDFTSPLPAISTMDLFGLPLGEWREFADPLHRITFTPKEDPEFLNILKGWEWVRKRIEEEIETRRMHPRDDLLTHLATGEIDGRPLDRETIWGIALNILIGGVDTTTALTTHTLIYLAENPAERTRLIVDPKLLPVAREEFVRFFSPIHGLARNARSSAVVRGQTIDAGERVYLAYASANRDEDVFDQPDSIDMTRFPNRHIGFGAGQHRCLGSFQARMMFAAMMNQILTRIPDYAIDLVNAQPYRSIGTVNGWASVPATFTPGPRTGATLD